MLQVFYASKLFRINYESYSQKLGECLIFNYYKLCLLELNSREVSAELVKDFYSFIVEELQIQDPLVSIEDQYGQTPLHMLALSNNHLAIRDLLSSGSKGRHFLRKHKPQVPALTFWTICEIQDIDKATLEEKQTPLHYAAKAGSLEAADYLATNLECNLSAEDVYARTPFFLAAEYGSY